MPSDSEDPLNASYAWKEAETRKYQIPQLLRVFFALDILAKYSMHAAKHSRCARSHLGVNID